MENLKSTFSTCLSYLCLEALKEGSPLIADILQKANNELRHEVDTRSSLQKHSHDKDSDLMYAFNLFVEYMRADSKKKRKAFLDQLQKLES